MTARAAFAVVACLLAVPALADGPGPQLLLQIESGLAQRGIEADLTSLTTAQAAALHLELSSPNDTEEIRSRSILLSILDSNPDTKATKR